MRVKIAAGHEYDLVSSKELSEEMKELRHRFDEMWRQEVRGIKWMEQAFALPSTPTSYTIEGPEQGFAWSVKIFSTVLTGADTMSIYKGESGKTIAPVAVLGSNTTQVATWTSNTLILRPGEVITAVTSGAFRLSTVYVSAVQVPAERLGILLA